mgnify:CR=1 FL=1|jgi:hypothetical protein
MESKIDTEGTGLLIFVRLQPCLLPPRRSDPQVRRKEKPSLEHIAYCNMWHDMDICG